MVLKTKCSAENSREILLWVSRNYYEAINIALPNSEIEDQEYWDRVEWASGVRMLPSPNSKDESEFQFLLQKNYENEFSIHVVIPHGSPVRAQLADLRKKYPDQRIEISTKRLSFDSYDFTGNDFPQLAILAEKLEKLRIACVLSSELYMDPPHIMFGRRLEREQ